MNLRIKYLLVLLLMVQPGAILIGQELTAEIANNIKYGRTENLIKFTSPALINQCLGVKDSKKYNFLAISIKLKSLKSLKFFIENGADVNSACADKTPLMYAAKYGQLEMAKYLVEKGADIEVSIRGYKAINYARRYNHPEISRFLKAQRVH